MIDLHAYPHQTITITNRHGLDVFIRFNGEVNGRPLALLAHGLSDAHDSDALRAITSALIETGHNVLVWDATHSTNRSGGTLRQATVTAAYQDMADVAAWAAAQPWYHDRFVLAGHSMGAAAALMLASAEPKLISRLILIAPLVSGKLAAKRINFAVRWLWRVSRRLPLPDGSRNVLGYNLLRDGLNYDGQLLAANLEVSTVIIVGDDDKTTPSRESKLLFDVMAPQWRHLVIIPGANHVFGASLADLETAAKTAIWLV
ncbi:alpha/beta fold hydrolase [Candidatus Saccharibacteria bacterium]|nr:alpha/beta fold hydrolase [Candidatus Saccharibacteria bacterium]